MQAVCHVSAAMLSVQVANITNLRIMTAWRTVVCILVFLLDILPVLWEICRQIIQGNRILSLFLGHLNPLTLNPTVLFHYNYQLVPR